MLGWYRIPVRFAPKVVQVDYLAFYQTSSFSDHHACKIEVFSELKGVELTTRRILFSDEPDHPRADEEYYKIQIGPLQNLLAPIMAGKWKRITFLYTTGKLLARAAVVNDLVIRDEDRKILWHSLREKANESQSYKGDENSEAFFDPGVPTVLEELRILFDRENW